MKYTKELKELSKKDVNIAGGKGASLGEMFNQGIPVPDGFVVTSDTFDYFLEKVSLDKKINEIISKIDKKEDLIIQKASEDIQSLIFNTEIPKEIGEEILNNFKNKDMEYVAVRSSATAEDGAENAWAGQLDSFLNTKE